MGSRRLVLTGLLALAGVLAFSSDASAFGRRRGGGCNGGGGAGGCWGGAGGGYWSGGGCWGGGYGGMAGGGGCWGSGAGVGYGAMPAGGGCWGGGGTVYPGGAGYGAMPMPGYSAGTGVYRATNSLVGQTVPPPDRAAAGAVIPAPGTVVQTGGTVTTTDGTVIPAGYVTPYTEGGVQYLQNYQAPYTPRRRLFRMPRRARGRSPRDPSDEGVPRQ
jgi:hypothetical protein